MIDCSRVPLGRKWVATAIREIERDFARSADTHLIRVELPHLPTVKLYLKDESTHPTGSLKHRLARSLFLYAICNGWIREGRPVVEASSGSTAISEAYFARLIGVPFIAIIPRGIAERKVAEIEHYGGRCHFVDDASEASAAAAALAEITGGHFLDQFTYAERATDWRGNNNIAESLFAQMNQEEDPCPDWVVVGAGTGGTSATLGRFIRYRAPYSSRTRLCVVDPDGSAFYPFYRDSAVPSVAFASSVIEGVGRPRVEPSFLPEVIDQMIYVPDPASIAACHWLARLLGRRCGPSTGMNIIGALLLADEMRRAQVCGSVVTLICDAGDRYLDTIYSDDWLQAQNLDTSAWMSILDSFSETGIFDAPLEAVSRTLLSEA